MLRIAGLTGRLGSAVLIVAAAALSLGGCGTAATTPPPTAATSTPTATPTPTAVATPTPTSSATPSSTPVVSPSSSPSATTSATPTSRAAGCTGSPDNQAFFVEAAAALSFDVYCAVLPSGWWLQSGSYTGASGGFVQVEYKTAGTSYFDVWEGSWCPPSKACIGPGGLLGPASFGGLSGSLYLNNTTYTLRVGSVSHQQYLMVGSGMNQAQFVALAAALIKVPKS